MLSEWTSWGPYLLVSVALLVGVSRVRARRRQGRTVLVEEPVALEHLSARQFESLVRTGFEQQGYTLVDAPRSANDGHGELMMRRDRETVLVQCRHWRMSKVGVEQMRAMQTAMLARSVTSGFVLTTGRFGREAKAHAAGFNVRLIDGLALPALIGKARHERTSRPRSFVDTYPAA